MEINDLFDAATEMECFGAALADTREALAVLLDNMELDGYQPPGAPLDTQKALGYVRRFPGYLATLRIFGEKLEGMGRHLDEATAATYTTARANKTA
ncbi:MAG: hypothetical protein IJ751_01415 [Oscillospiraceae bacterium]|nr:hypothetical protein [Oscillospiraceae bacterium]